MSTPTKWTDAAAREEFVSPRVILASTSQYRRALLGRLQIPFERIAPDVDESQWQGKGQAPLALAEFLAHAKGESVAKLHPDAIVIGSDQVVEFDGEAINKPGSSAAAALQLEQLSGREHTLITAATVFQGKDVWRHTDVTRLVMRKLTRAEIERYVAMDQPVDCAGSYKIESLGIALFERIETADHTAITGLPLLFISSKLRSLGVRVP